MNNYLFYACIYCAECLILYLYCQTFFKARLSGLYRALIFAGGYITLYLLSFLHIGPLNGIGFLIVTSLIIRYCYDTSLRIAVFHSFILTLLMILTEALVILIFPDIVKNIVNEENIHGGSEIICTILMKLLYLFISQVICHLFTKQSNNKTRTSDIIIFSLIPLCSCVITINIGNTYLNYSLSSTTSILLILSLMLLLVINILMFSIQQYNQKKSQDYYELQMQLQREYDYAQYYKMLIENDEKERILIHDIKKHLNAISFMNEQQNYDKISSYINELLNDNILSTSAKINNNEIINVIFSQYSKRAKDNNINLSVDIRNNTLDFINDNDCTALFCNLLDNAFTAAEKTKNPFVEVSASHVKESSSLLIRMINSCESDPFSNGELRTTKKDKKMHGLGLKSIKSIVKKYNGDMEQFYKNDDCTFNTVIHFDNIS